MNNKNDDKKRQEDKLNRAIQIGLSAERVSRFGDAGKEYFVAYSGKDNATGQTMSRGLKQISDSKVNKAYEYQNIKQQAGFSAEVMSVHDKNAENIINGNGERWCRSEDDLNINSVAHKFGIQCAKDDVMLAGACSLIKNTGDCLRGNIEKSEAAKNVIKDIYRYLQNEISGN